MVAASRGAAEMVPAMVEGAGAPVQVQVGEEAPERGAGIVITIAVTHRLGRQERRRPSYDGACTRSPNTVIHIWPIQQH